MVGGELRRFLSGVLLVLVVAVATPHVFIARNSLH